MGVNGKRRVALVGAGNIAQAHAQALSALPNVEIAAVVDPREAAAKAMASNFGIELAVRTLEEALEKTQVDCAHILVPPHLHHEVAGAWLDNGVAVLSEKPLAESAEQCRDLVSRAEKSGAALGVNQNFVYHPAFQELMHHLSAGAVGRLRHADMIFAMPLRQLDAGQLGHWMFRQPLNILLEQAVHPLSQLRHLLGPMSVKTADAGQGEDIAEAVRFHRKWHINLEGAQAGASLSFAVGESFPVCQLTVVGSDGLIVADMVRNWTYVLERSRWPDAYDMMRCGSRAARQMRRGARQGFFDYALSQLGLKPRSDAFYQSMLGSIRAFYDALDNKKALPLDGAFGADLVQICEDACRLAGVQPNEVRAKARAASETCDVAVLGGTGFIGRELVRQLTEKGLKTRVMARNVSGLPSLFSHNLVDIVRGDVTHRDDVAKAVSGAKYVVNLAHGGGGASREAIYKALAGSAQLVGQICLEQGVKRLVHVSSIAALYLGDVGDVITPDTPCDPKSSARNDYSWAKAEAEHILMKMHKEDGLPVTIQRPGLVVGQGAPPFHSGLGFFNNEQHCIGWNEGENPLPFVLVEDTARAIALGLEAEDVDGRSDNIVGDVYMTAKEFYGHIENLSGRPLRYHPQSPAFLQASEIFKWVIKRAGGRKAPFPSYRDLLSRGLKARFDCIETKSKLGWKPNMDRGVFIEQAIASAFPDAGENKAAQQKAAA